MSLQSREVEWWGPPAMPTLPFDMLQKLDLPLTEMVCSRLSFVHDFFLSFPFEVRSTLPEGAGDLVVLAGKSDWEERMRQLGEHPGRVVLVFAQGDAPIRDPAGRRGLPPNVTAVYATNNELADRRAIAVPLGVRINKLRPLQFVRQNHSGSRDGLLYGNFALKERYYPAEGSGAPHIRARLVERLHGEPWANLDVSADHREDPADLVRFYSQTAGHKFVLSPEGRGIDCYRTWESLYLGAIPIVMVSSAMSAFAGLPILFTEDYSELSEDYLERRWREMSRLSYEIELLTSSYYLCHFIASIGALRDPRFVCWKVDGSLADAFVGALRLERVGEGLRITVQEGDRALAEVPLKTIAGAPFRLGGLVRPEADATQALTVDIVDEREVIATAEVGAGRAARLRLDFVARSDRAVLSIKGPETEASWMVSDLSVGAIV